MDVTTIVPGKSMGDLRLGARVAELPKSASVANNIGEVDGIHFSVVDGRVDDVWIEDLRTFAKGVQFDGRALPRDIALSDLKKIFGNCERVAVKGGVFFNCDSGVTVGTDFEETGKFIQLRLKKR